MVFRADRFIFIAICASLLLHAGLLTVAATKAHYGRIYLPPLRRPLGSVVIQLQPLDEMGERAGTGTASSSSKGDKPLQARQADQDQPQLSRDPTGPAKLAHAPNPSEAPPGERGRGGQRGEISIATPSEKKSQASPEEQPSKPSAAVATVSPPKAPAPKAPAPTPPQTTAQTHPPTPAPTASGTPAEIASDSPAKAKALLAAPAEKLPPAAAPTPERPVQAPTAPAPVQVAIVALPTPPAEKQSAKPSPQAATGDGLAPGRAAAADPFQQSDSESDAFTTVGAAVVHDGRISVRGGRKIKTVRPDLLVPGILDTIGVSDPTVQLKVNVDPTGKVTLVTVVHSSGSNDIDQPCVVAMYDWWFEPNRDRTGKPIADVVLFTLSFR